VLIAGERAMHVEIGIPTAGAMAEIRRSILQEQIAYRRRHSARAAAGLVVGRSARAPADGPAAQHRARLGSGDFSARTGLRHNHTEFGQLATTFDAVGTELEARTRQLAAAKERAEETPSSCASSIAPCRPARPRSFWSTRCTTISRSSM